MRSFSCRFPPILSGGAIPIVGAGAGTGAVADTAISSTFVASEDGTGVLSVGSSFVSTIVSVGGERMAWQLFISDCNKVSVSKPKSQYQSREGEGR